MSLTAHMKAFFFGPDRRIEETREIAEPLPDATDDGYRLVMVNTPIAIEHEATAIYQRRSEVVTAGAR